MQTTADTTADELTLNSTTLPRPGDPAHGTFTLAYVVENGRLSAAVASASLPHITAADAREWLATTHADDHGLKQPDAVYSALAAMLPPRQCVNAHVIETASELRTAGLTGIDLRAAQRHALDLRAADPACVILVTAHLEPPTPSQPAPAADRDGAWAAHGFVPFSYASRALRFEPR
jgi:hypothetical protein